MYLSAFRSSGEAVQASDLFGPLARFRHRSGVSGATLEAGPFMAIATDDDGHRPLLARVGDLHGVGDVRLDNRAELVALNRRELPASASDLDVVLGVLDRFGEQAIPRIIGDFAFIVWDRRAGRLMAVRDAIGIKPLYYSNVRGTLLFSSRMDLLAGGDFDLEHVADLLTGMTSPEDRTIWSGVRPIPAGGYLVQRGTLASGRRYWSADSFEPESSADPRERVEEFRTLFRTAVRSRLGAPMSTWAQLSGGIDSSSVVATAQDLYGGERMAGTITVVDAMGAGDERRYSDAVVNRFGLRNEKVTDFWAWQDDGTSPPLTEGPRPLFPFFARDRHMVDVVRGNGGRVVLSGFGADHYLMGNLRYMADMAVRGRVTGAIREAAQWSIQSRQSFWGMLGNEVVRPLLRRRGPAADVPAWIDGGFARSTRIEDRLAAGQASADRPGQLFASRVARDVRSLPAWADRWPFEDGVEIRYPFLHRPLVEAGLRLPPTLRIRPGATKWILREAMRGLLPEEVRQRNAKGSIDARILWSLTRERTRVDTLLRDPILAQLGCIDAGKLRRAVDDARRGVVGNLVHLMSALSLETWLAVRAGTWSVPVSAATAA